MGRVFSSRCGARVNSQDHGQSQVHVSKQLSRTNKGSWCECNITTLCARTSTNANYSLNAFVKHNVAVELSDPSSNALREDFDNV